MSQYEQENDFGRGGGELDDESLERAWEEAAKGWSTRNVDEEGNLTERGAEVAEQASDQRWDERAQER